jgi:phosphoglucomutase
MIAYLFRNRPAWPAAAAIGKTVVSSQLIDRITTRMGRRLVEVPVGFKWFVGGLFDGTLGFAGEESAGASCLRRTGGVWTTDKDGFVPALLAAEITATMHRDPGELYRDLTRDCGEPVYDRVEAPATGAEKVRLASLSAKDVTSTQLAGEAITAVLTHAPGNNAAIGGIKVVTGSGWFAARPSGTESIYKIYAESFRGSSHLGLLVAEAQTLVNAAIASPSAHG